MDSISFSPCLVNSLTPCSHISFLQTTVFIRTYRSIQQQQSQPLLLPSLAVCVWWKGPTLSHDYIVTLDSFQTCIYPSFIYVYHINGDAIGDGPKFPPRETGRVDACECDFVEHRSVNGRTVAATQLLGLQHGSSTPKHNESSTRQTECIPKTLSTAPETIDAIEGGVGVATSHHDSHIAYGKHWSDCGTNDTCS